MREYLTMLLAVCALVALGSLASYKENDGYLKAALSILLCLSVISPLASAIKSHELDLTTPELDAQTSAEEYLKTVLSAYERGVREHIASELSVDGEGVEVEVLGFDAQSFTADSITVRLSGGAILADPERIKYIIERDLGIENVLVKYD